MWSWTWVCRMGTRGRGGEGNGNESAEMKIELATIAELGGVGLPVSLRVGLRNKLRLVKRRAAVGRTPVQREAMHGGYACSVR